MDCGVTLGSQCTIYIYNSPQFVWWIVYPRLGNKTEADSGLAYDLSPVPVSAVDGLGLRAPSGNPLCWPYFPACLPPCKPFFCCSPDYYPQFSEQKPLPVVNEFARKASLG